jgi:protein-disulfide isomerase
MNINFLVRSPLLKVLTLGALVSTTPLFTSVAKAEISDADFAKAIESYLSKDDNVDKIAKSFERYAQKRQASEAKKQAEAQKKEMEEQFKNPVKFDIGNAPVKGNPNAKITVVEFSDFQCPYCKRGMEVVEEILKAYPNDVKVAFKNLPLPFHDQARPAAKAALAAGKQGKFWEMYELLFLNQQELGDAGFAKFAAKLGLDMDKFKADAASAEIEAQIAKDEKDAEELGFNGTPAFLVGGVKVTGARPMPFFKEVIERIKAGK